MLSLGLTWKRIENKRAQARREGPAEATLVPRFAFVGVSCAAISRYDKLGASSRVKVPVGAVCILHDERRVKIGIQGDDGAPIAAYARFKA